MEQPPAGCHLCVRGAASRLVSIDAVRGLAMVLMALDHVRDFFADPRIDPLDLSHTSVLLFVTRWITHLCAPLFIFLAGVSSHLLSQHRTRAGLGRYLLIRGLWLIVLEITVVDFAWTFDLSYQTGLYLQVIWAIGVAMIVLATLIDLPLVVIAAFSIIVVAGHNLFDSIAAGSWGDWAPLWTILHVQGPVPHGFIEYPLIPWIAVMSLGYSMGPIFQLDAQRRRRALVCLGAVSLTAFGLLRMLNVYGDPRPWSLQSTAAATLLSILNVQKYPPSLQFLLLTLGSGFLLLAAFEFARGRVSEVLCTFGRVPLFFYVLHIVLAHFAAGIVGLTMGFGAALFATDFISIPTQWGFGLPVIYLMWLLAVLTLYPACRWFAEVKRRRADWWLSYL
jgi:uncharacterized membrane protein